MFGHVCTGYLYSNLYQALLSGCPSTIQKPKLEGAADIPGPSCLHLTGRPYTTIPGDPEGPGRSVVGNEELFRPELCENTGATARPCGKHAAVAGPPQRHVGGHEEGTRMPFFSRNA